MTRDGTNPSGTSLVVYSLQALRTIEAQIAKQVSQYFARSSEVELLAWQRSFYRREEIPMQRPADFIEDMVAHELNADFIPMYQCPACSRIAIKRGDSDQWTFFKPEASGNSSS
jgi:hypothetical protein